MAIFTAGLVSYSFAAVIFGALALLVIVAARPELKAGVLILASLVTAAWAILNAWSLYSGSVLIFPLFIMEVLRDAAWFTLLLSLLSGEGGKHAFKWLPVGAHTIWLALAIASIVLLKTGSLISPLGVPSLIVSFGPLALALIGLILIEQIIRNAGREFLWAVKYLCLGVGALFAFDIYLYADAIMYRNLNMHLVSARGAVAVISAVLIGISARRNPQWAPDIFISRRAVFFSGTLVTVGLYLILVALGGYYIREFGGSWAAFVQSLFFFSAIVGLLVIVLSGRVRARLMVFLSKNFYKNKYEYRDEWLKLIDSLDAIDSDEPLARRATRAMARIIGSDGGVMWYLRGDKFHPVNAWNMKQPSGELVLKDSAFANVLQTKAWIFDSKEYGYGEHFLDEKEVPEWLLTIEGETLTVPLLHRRRLLGFIVLQRPSESFTLTYEDIDLLRTAGRQVASYMAQETATQQLAESRQFEAYNRLTSFIMHDLKNLIAQQSLVVKNAARHKSNPEFVDDAIVTIDNSVQRMNHLLLQLRQGEAPDAENRLKIRSIVEQVIADTSDRKPTPVLKNTDNFDAAILADRERFANVLSHLVRNAQDATPESGSISVEISQNDGMVAIEITDNGEGMTDLFIRDRLFKPFDSTKGAQGMGIGAYQAQQFAINHGGNIEVKSQEAGGTTFRIVLPSSSGGNHDQLPSGKLA